MREITRGVGNVPTETGPIGKQREWHLQRLSMRTKDRRLDHVQVDTWQIDTHSIGKHIYQGIR